MNSFSKKQSWYFFATDVIKIGQFQAAATNGTARAGGAGDNRQEPAIAVQAAAALPTNDVDMQANGHDAVAEVRIRLG